MSESTVVRPERRWWVKWHLHGLITTTMVEAMSSARAARVILRHTPGSTIIGIQEAGG